MSEGIWSSRGLRIASSFVFDSLCCVGGGCCFGIPVFAECKAGGAMPDGALGSLGIAFCAVEILGAHGSPLSMVDLRACFGGGAIVPS